MISNSNIYYSDVWGKQIFASRKCDKNDIVDFYKAIKKIPEQFLNYLIKDGWVIGFLTEDEACVISSSLNNSFTNYYRKFIAVSKRESNKETVEQSLLREIGNVMNHVAHISNSKAFRGAWCMDMFPFLVEYGSKIDRNIMKNLSGVFSEVFFKYVENPEFIKNSCPKLYLIFTTAEKLFAEKTNTAA